MWYSLASCRILHSAIIIADAAHSLHLQRYRLQRCSVIVLWNYKVMWFGDPPVDIRPEIMLGAQHGLDLESKTSCSKALLTTLSSDVGATAGAAGVDNARYKAQNKENHRLIQLCC
ncbi:hypothetical protein AVEN_236563-1 [Araneus ventricosus]|uniref:Uncharacterized protein n=1 Tax=Araneus ventricosus TaxID=182803 RepID=A0A4Y2TY78_ARAVE|nr:hypothetical protein AVEN_236563-1 [Araneus ventricosus]